MATADIPAGPANDFPDLQNDPHLKAVDFFQHREHPTEGGYWETQPPVQFVGQQKREITPAPRVGEHTDEVLAELGLKKD
jgi:crotonobetainyl-CoA:carnitine CoA-transferase CaiB-like acyl-CoA transferase